MRVHDNFLHALQQTTAIAARSYVTSTRNITQQKIHTWLGGRVSNVGTVWRPIDAARSIRKQQSRTQSRVCQSEMQKSKDMIRSCTPNGADRWCAQRFDMGYLMYLILVQIINNEDKTLQEQECKNWRHPHDDLPLCVTCSRASTQASSMSLAEVNLSEVTKESLRRAFRTQNTSEGWLVQAAVHLQVQLNTESLSYKHFVFVFAFAATIN